MKKSNLFKRKELILQILLWIFAILVLAINLSLIFDNVLWGDEAFSANVIRDTDAHGIYQRLYYWDNHPPLFYYFLKLVGMIFGYNTPAYHLAPFFTFAIGIVLGCVLLPKKIGAIPTAFFVLFSGLSATCVEYNVEVRMYSMAFFFAGLAVYFAYKILEGSKIVYWVLLTVSAVLSAYSHYYGAMTTGIVIFFTSLFFYIKNRKKTWIYGVCSVAGYFILYAPWLVVTYHHIKTVTGGWWMENPDKLSAVVEFICGGARFKELVLPLIIMLTIAVFVLESGLLSFDRTAKRTIAITLNKPCFDRFTTDFKVIMLCWCTIISELLLVYVLCYAVRPILAYRYTYMLVPLVITIVILLIKTYVERVGTKKIGQALIGILFIAMLVSGLLDFKEFRSVSKVEDEKLSEVLSIIGEPTETTVMADNGVSHLSYTVLEYYYPDTLVFDSAPATLERDMAEFDELEDVEVDNIWMFCTDLLDDKETEYLESLGYKLECFEDRWFGKYPCDIYRIYKD